MSTLLIQKHKCKLPTGKDAFLIGNDSEMRGFRVPDYFDLRKPQDHPKYGKIYFRGISGCFFYYAYSENIDFAQRTESGFFDYLLYDGGHKVIKDNKPASASRKIKKVRVSKNGFHKMKKRQYRASNDPNTWFTPNTIDKPTVIKKNGIWDRLQGLRARIANWKIKSLPTKERYDDYDLDLAHC